MDVPVIVAVNGLCVGAGLNFVAAADLVLASEKSWFSDPMSLGARSALWSPCSLPQVPYSVIAKLVLLGSSYRMSARDALAAGIVHEVLEPNALRPRAYEMAESLVGQSPTPLRESLRILRRYARALLADQLDQAWA